MTLLFPRCDARLHVRAIGIRAALAGLVTLWAPQAAALALGEIAAVSAIGEPLRIEILLPGAHPESVSECLRVGSPRGEADGIPAISNARLTLQGRGPGARLLVMHTAPVFEPIARLSIDNVCGSRLRRDYVLLLADPGAPAVTVAAAPVQAAPRAPAPAPAATRGRSATTGGQQWTTVAGESAASIAQALYPHDSGARRAFAEGVLRANPGLVADASAALPAGTVINVPNLGRVAAASSHRAPTPSPRAEGRPPARQPTTTQQPARTPTPAQPAASPPSDRLVLESETRATERLTDTRADTGVSEAQQTAREERVVVAIDRTISTQLELLERIRRLEEIQLALRAQIGPQADDVPALAAAAPGASPQAATPEAGGREPASGPSVTDAANAPAGAATTAQASTATSAAASAHAASSERSPFDDWGMWPLVLGLAVAATTGVVLARRRRTPDAAQSATHGGIPGPTAQAKWAEEPTDIRETPIDPVRTALTPEQLQPYDALEWNRLPHPLAPEQDDTLAPVIQSSEEIEEHESAVELAEIMMSFGRVHGAAETLADFIRANPKRAINPWIKLLEAYRRAGMRSEFDALSRQLNKTFNVKTFTWDTFDDARKPTHSLEQLPHIVARLSELWGTRECQAYLEILLRDNRDGKREGFQIAIIDDILTLSAVLEQQLGRYRPEQAESTPSPSSET